MKNIDEIKKIIVEREGYKYMGSIADNACGYGCYRNGATELQILEDNVGIKGCTSDSFTIVASVTAKDDSDVMAKNNPKRSIIVSKKTNDDSKLFICSGIFRFVLEIGDDGKISIITPNEEKYIYFADDEYGVYYKFMRVLDDERASVLGSGIRIDDNIDGFVNGIRNMILEGLEAANISTRSFEELFEVIKTILAMCIIDYLKRKLKELKKILEVESDENRKVADFYDRTINEASKNELFTTAAILENDRDVNEKHVQMLTELVNSLSENTEIARRKLAEEKLKA